MLKFFEGSVLSEVCRWRLERWNWKALNERIHSSLSLSFSISVSIFHFITCSFILSSVTRFGKILKFFGQFWYGLFCIWQAIIHTATIFYATGQIFIVINGQRLKNNLAIWSHWFWASWLPSSSLFHSLYFGLFHLGNSHLAQFSCTHFSYFYETY